MVQYHFNPCYLKLNVGNAKTNVSVVLSNVGKFLNVFAFGALFVVRFNLCVLKPSLSNSVLKQSLLQILRSNFFALTDAEILV